MLYKEYIKVEEDFIPVFSFASDKSHPERWKSFYPHESFKNILTLTVETLEKASAAKDRPIWINGSYGTGKTFASFVIKHIFEDDFFEVEKYFRHHEMDSLIPRVAALRDKGKILVVHQSSSSGINSQNKLFNAIIEAVKISLRDNGYTYTGAASILEKVLATIKDPDSTFNFKAAFKNIGHGSWTTLRREKSLRIWKLSTLKKSLTCLKLSPTLRKASLITGRCPSMM